MKGFTIWFTGLSGAGKSTLAQEIEMALLERGLNVEVLDGDIIRENLSKGLSFSKEDRDTNLHRIAFVCNLLARNGVIAIAAAISPYKDTRQAIREKLGRFVMVHADCPIEVLKERDPKGLYKKALAGEIKHFTGIDDPFEPPEKPEIACHTDSETVEESTATILKTLEILGYIPAMDSAQYNPEEEAKIKQRLKDLGYI